MPRYSDESSRRRLKDILKGAAGKKKDVIRAAYELADEDPRSTLDIVETPIDEQFDDSEDAAEMLRKFGKPNRSHKNKRK